MKTVTSEESPRRVKRIPKPMMEKRRRDRINQSLEALRQLMLENTRNERLKNPKVEKAEILESVVQFLQADSPQASAGASSAPRDQCASCAHQQSYRAGVRSCLLRVSHFIAAKSQQLEEEAGGGGPQAPPGPLHPAGPPPIPPPPPPRSFGGGTEPVPHGTGPLLLRTGAVDVSEPVWRPWPL